MVNIVIADDHKLVRQAIAHMLTANENCHVVGEANDGKQLLELLKAQTPDVVILDLNMPELNGLAALEKMRTDNCTVPVLIVSAEDDGQNIRSALKAGAKGYLPKHANSEELIFAIKSVVCGNTYVSPSLVSNLIESENEPHVNGKNPFKKLSKRELEITKYLADGKPNREIASLLHISIRTVDTHRTNIMKKLHLKTNGELVKLALQCGLIKL